MTPQPEPLAARTARSFGWKVGSNLASVAVLAIRAVVLARLLEVATFGTYSLAYSIVRLTAVLAAFGFGEAMLHRAKQTADEERAAASHFTLSLVTTTAWLVILGFAATAVANPGMRTALLGLGAATFVTHLAQTPTLILVRRVQHRRLAVLEFVTAVLTTAVAISLALAGGELWALLATDMVAAAASLVMLYLWRPVWRPRLVWSRDAFRYFINFGSRSLLANLTAQACERLDSLWTGLALGTQPLGFYSRALTFAGYPRRVIANAVNTVSIGTFAEIKGEGERLSAAFREIMSFLLWVGFFATGLLAVASREFVVVILGDRWLPMLLPFRLLLLFALVSPIERSLANLLTAVGEPGRTAQARMVRLATLAVGLATLGPAFGVAGVAVAASAGVCAGVAMMLVCVRRHVRIRPMAIVGPPAAACLLGAASALGVARLADGDVTTGLIKVLTFAVAFIAIFLAASHRRLPALMALFRDAGGAPRPGGKSP